MASASEWASRVAAWRASGLSAKEFAAAHALTPSTLRWWAWHFARQSRGLVRVVAAPAPQSATLEVEVGGARVLVRRGFDRALLGEVVAALREERRS